MNYLFVCLIFGIFNNVIATLNGNCVLEEVTEIQWVTSYTNVEKDDDERTEFKRFKASNITEVTVVSDGAYFSVNLEEEFLIIAPSAVFAEYENLEDSDSTKPTMVLNLNFVCNDGTADLAFYQPINDLNTFMPNFGETTYSYTVPMPLPGNFDMQCLFGDPIEACDSDITNTQVDFSIEPAEDFSIVWESTTDETNKCHKALIKTLGPVRLASDKEYTLTVTDTGNPTKSGSAKLQLRVDEQTAIPANPQFTSAYYTATYNNENEQHTVDVQSIIALESKNPKLEATLSGEHKDNFDMQLIDGIITITLKSNLAEDVINDNVIVLLTIEATLEQAEGPGRTVLVVYLPKQQCPQTTTAEPATCPTQSICPICTTEAPTTCPEQVICPISTTASPTTCPEQTVCPICTTEAPTTCPEESTCPICTTQAPTTCPDQIICPICTTEAPTTWCPPCPTTESTSTTTECSPCSTTTSSTLSTECPTTDFSTECPPCSTTPSDCTECTTTACTDTTTSSTLITECPATDASTECPPCPTTTNPPTGPKVTFEQENYIFNVPSKDGVTVGIVKAIPSTDEVIKYSLLKGLETEVPSQLKIGENNGILTVKQKLEVGVYEIMVNAVGKTTNAIDEANILINVYQELETTDSVIVRQVDEDSESSIPIPCPGGDNTCSYEFGDQYPPTDSQLFTFKDGSLHYQKLHLQMAEVKDLLVPQFIVTLKLVPVSRSWNSTSLSQRIFYEDEDIRRYVYLPENLPRIPDTLLVSIIINDINNHKPAFSVENPLIIGYPGRTLSNQLLPPHLVQVQATDLDVGIHADIRYSTTHSNFVIHPKTGLVYPGEGAFQNEADQTFTVTATDMDGEGMTSTLNIVVKHLQQQHLTVLEIKNKFLEDVNDIIEKLSQETGLNINYLTAAVVPTVSTSTYFVHLRNKINGLFKSAPAPRDDTDHLIKLVIYALDGSNEPVEAKDLQTSLEDVEAFEDLTVDEWIPPEVGGIGDKPINTVGFIAAIAVLGSLLVIFIIAVALIYFLKIRKQISKPKPYDTMDEEDTASIKFEKAEKSGVSEDIAKRRPTGFVFNPPPPEDDEHDNEDTSNLKNVKQKQVDVLSTSNPGWQSNYGSSISYAEPIDYEESKEKNESSDYEDIAELKDQRKSVSFKTTVQKINIVMEDEKHAEDDNDVDIRL